MSRRSHATASPGHPAATPASFVWPPSWCWLLIFFSTLIAYWPALTGGFLWDDNAHVTRVDLRSLAGLGRIWFEVGATQQYYPLLHSAFWIEHRMWGDATLGYHLVNLLQHATAALLFGLILRRLAVPGAWLAAGLFALHPVCVESVAWISEQKNTLSAVLYLGAALVYLRFERERHRGQYVLATALFVLALLTKTVTATLPAALLVIAWCQSGRLVWRRDVVPLLPWFVLGAAGGGLTAWFEHTLIGAKGAAFELGALGRILLAGRVIWFYLAKLAWPANLIFIYPRWTIDPAAAWQYGFVLAAVGALAVLLWLAWRRQLRAPLAVALLFIGTLFPVLGFVNVFPFIYSFVADHFQYLASLSIFAGTAAALTLAWTRWSLPAPRIFAGVLLLVLGTLTWRQSTMYRDSVELYETTLARNPDCWMAYNNLGILLADSGQHVAAIHNYENALRLRPENAEAENNFGYALTRLGRNAEALPHFHRALQLQPDYNQAYNNLGVALMALGRNDEGLAAFAEALRQSPRYAGAHYNLGLALARLGRTTEAVPHFQRAVEIQPDYADAELNWAIGLMLTGRFPESVPHFERAIQLSPDSPDNHHTYGRALANAGRYEDAISQYRESLRLNPDFGAAHLHLAIALRQVGRLEEAQYHYLAAQRLGATSN